MRRSLSWSGRRDRILRSTITMTSRTTTLRLTRFLLAASLLVQPASLLAQGAADQKGADQKAPASANDVSKDDKRRIDEFAEAARVLGGPASNPECVWLGRRVVNLLWRDDLDTAFRHLDLYDRFGCPGGHIQSTFRCLVRQGNIDPKAQESVSARTHACWINPNLQPAASAQNAPAGAGSVGTASAPPQGQPQSAQ